MTKTTAEFLLDEVGSYLITFLKHGNISSFTKKIDEELNIDDMEKLLRIHFVLRNDVIEFIEHVPQWIRRIKTTTIQENERQHGKIRGKIDWQKTIKQRCSENFADPTLFSVNRRERNYGISENIVLKELLSIIHNIVFQDLKPAIQYDHPWLKEWTTENLTDIVKSVYLKNIYIRRIRQQGHKDVTQRMISNARKSRTQLYRTAAALLSDYQKLMNFDINPDEAEQLLQNTFIKPEKIEVLFELYWTFQVIRAMTEDDKSIRFHLIEGDHNIVAEWEDSEFLYRIYHDSTGTFSFYEHWADIELPEKDGYLKREGKVIQNWQTQCKKMLDMEKSDTLWGGRPDILVEKCEKDNQKLCQVFIGEVKYTRSKNYAAQGLKELLEYMALIRQNNRYFERNPDRIFVSDKIKGWLFVDTMEIQSHVSDNIAVIPLGDNQVKVKERLLFKNSTEET